LSEAQTRRFYTALYHASTQPRDRPLDQPAKELGPSELGRSLHPVGHLSDPVPADVGAAAQRIFAANLNSLIHTFDKFGAADTAIIGGQNYHVGQGGDEVDNVLGEAALRGVQGVNWNDAWRVTHFNAYRASSAALSAKRLFRRRRPQPGAEQPARQVGFLDPGLRAERLFRRPGRDQGGRARRRGRGADAGDRAKLAQDLESGRRKATASRVS
jgi:hypothetical protein